MNTLIVSISLSSCDVSAICCFDTVGRVVLVLHVGLECTLLEMQSDTF